MATYTIRTTRTQEIGLGFAFDTYADKNVHPDRASYFQYRIDLQVSNPMYDDYLRANSVALDKSIATIPEANMPAAQAEIEAVIVAHGGTLVPPGPVIPPIPPTSPLMMAPPIPPVI